MQYGRKTNVEKEQEQGGKYWLYCWLMMLMGGCWMQQAGRPAGKFPEWGSAKCRIETGLISGPVLIRQRPKLVQALGGGD